MLNIWKKLPCCACATTKQNTNKHTTILTCECVTTSQDVLVSDVLVLEWSNKKKKKRRTECSKKRENKRKTGNFDNSGKRPLIICSLTTLMQLPLLLPVGISFIKNYIELSFKLNLQSLEDVYFAKIQFVKIHFGNRSLKAVVHSFQKIW